MVQGLWCFVFLQPPSGQSDHRCSTELLSFLAHQPTQRQQQRRLQRQLRLETGNNFQMCYIVKCTGRVTIALDV